MKHDAWIDVLPLSAEGKQIMRVLGASKVHYQAELCHLQQQCATLQGALQQAQDTIAAQTLRITALELDNASLRDGINSYMQILDEQCKRGVAR